MAKWEGASFGFGDLAVGMKQQLGSTPGGFDVALVLSLSLPTGASAISSHGHDPSAQSPRSRALSSNWTAAGMLSVCWPTEQGRRNVTGETTFLMDRQLTKTWDAFVEYAGDFVEQGGPRHLVHFGTTHRQCSSFPSGSLPRTWRTMLAESPVSMPGASPRVFGASRFCLSCRRRLSQPQTPPPAYMNNDDDDEPTEKSVRRLELSGAAV